MYIEDSEEEGTKKESDIYREPWVKYSVILIFFNLQQTYWNKLFTIDNNYTIVDYIISHQKVVAVSRCLRDIEANEVYIKQTTYTLNYIFCCLPSP